MALSFTVIGMSDNPRPSFSRETLDAISCGRVFSGGKRHHQIVESLLPRDSLWIDITVPLDDVYEKYRKEDCHIIVFASGDPLFFGFASTLQRVMPDVPMKVYPYFNSLQILAHKLLMPYHDMHIVSLTGRPWKEFDNALIEHREKIGLLTDRKKTPDEIARRMKDYGFTFYSMHIGEHLGNPESEQISSLSIEDASKATFSNPNCLILTIQDNAPARRFGIPESEFDLLDGRQKMITKMPVRLLTLQALELYRRKTFWDIGFCTGSISIEARLAFPHLDIKAFEIRPEGKDLMESNSRKFSTPGIEYHIGDFLETEIDETCDATFIGGHGGHLEGIMRKVHSHLAPGGCIVFNSVTSNLVAAGSKDDFIQIANSLGMKLAEPMHVILDNNNPIDILKAEK
ncbi:MAG: precorrin-6y C5,15-methyltransferase (decarboxylating) subunit CbiE [Bacteroidales bacterium]|nr:precorrin-6y C5,15-methyltransferase (decarboxylating) subunit CbiE [Bacteroidales bacterium]